ncbi:exodeoxyribonuclease V subunit alpha [Georgenia muralis]
MTTTTMATADAADPRRALRATGLLADFNAAGVLAAADVHVASRLGGLTGETDERVLLAVGLAVRGVRAGSVCVSLEDRAALADADQEVAVDDLPWPERDGWVRAIEASRLVAVGLDGDDGRPVRWAGDRLYLDRYWRHELLVRRAVDARLGAGVLDVDGAALAAAVGRLFPARDDARQRLAAAAAALGRFTVLTGGPGTGKTTTVARMVAVLQEVAGPGLRVALAAPTGKAAARLQESVRAELGRLAGGDATGRDARGRDATTIGDAAPTAVATTIHRLLGWRPDSSTRFRHDARHHLPHDVVVVDETSMVSLPLMAHLLEALRPDARLVLVGDPDQLASVEAGAVLGDLVHRAGRPGPGPAEALAAVVPGDLPEDDADLRALRSGVVRLEKVHRQERDSAILPLAAAVRAGDADAVLGLLRAGRPGVSFVETSGERPTDAELAALRDDVADAGVDIVTAAGAGDAAAALRALARHRVMVAHRRGPFGVAHWSHQVEQWVEEAMARERTRARSAHDRTLPAGVHPAGAPWYPGRPLLVTTNDRDSGLYNGDTGVVVDDGRGGVVAVFGDPSAPLAVRPHRLPEVETVHAMTVHRGQGSQFEHVSLVLPPATSPLLTRELLYTAVTRATTTVRVVGTEGAVRAAVTTPVRRASGLREDLA